MCFWKKKNVFYMRNDWFNYFYLGYLACQKPVYFFIICFFQPLSLWSLSLIIVGSLSTFMLLECIIFSRICGFFILFILKVEIYELLGSFLYMFWYLPMHGKVKVNTNDSSLGELEPSSWGQFTIIAPVWSWLVLVPLFVISLPTRQSFSGL